MTIKNEQVKIPINQAFAILGGFILLLLIIIGVMWSIISNLNIQNVKLQKDIEYLQKEVDKINTVKKVMMKYQCDDPVVLSAIMKTFCPITMANLIANESGFVKRATSWCGAKGYTQCMPDKFDNGQDPYDTRGNISKGAAYLQEQFLKFGNMRDAFIAYNAGPFTVGKPLPQETKGYLCNIRRTQEEFRLWEAI